MSKQKNADENGKKRCEMECLRKPMNMSIPPTEVGIQFQWKLIIDCRHELRHPDFMWCTPSTRKTNNNNKLIFVVAEKCTVIR